MGKGIRRVGVKLANLLNRVPIPKKRTFSVEVYLEWEAFQALFTSKGCGY